MPAKTTLTTTKEFTGYEQEVEFLQTHVARMGVLSRPDPTAAGEGDAEATKLGDELEPTDTTVAEVAAIHEFGLGTQVERAPIRTAMDEKRNKIADEQEFAAGAVTDGTISGRQALGLVGEFAASMVRERLSEFLGPDISERRKIQKQRSRKRAGQTVMSNLDDDKPLINTAQLAGAYRWSIVKASEN
jgi:hypothetical protein